MAVARVMGTTTVPSSLVQQRAPHRLPNPSKKFPDGPIMLVAKRQQSSALVLPITPSGGCSNGTSPGIHQVVIATSAYTRICKTHTDTQINTQISTRVCSPDAASPNLS
ncbi:uncharacterized protein TM35_000221390 [Trypanosoma theileri]|uniref:Uncharacterized protein n=1 Tax=Trypanosoma theileri TaxID=67003 RepID=A0A1X0NTA1_9TRYP|nr:uncharacterized protein TM35_000221390 [Trypanosoma theileri]ORC87340.1 hypothetical protein TM35_000221390 [Trypanosoma theileri]